MTLTSIEELRTLRAKAKRPRRKIPVEKHHEIAHKHLVEGVSLRQLASEYGASHEAIRNIVDKI